LVEQDQLCRRLQFYRDLIICAEISDGVSLGLTGPNITSHAVDDAAKCSPSSWGAGANDQVMW